MELFLNFEVFKHEGTKLSSFFLLQALLGFSNSELDGVYLLGSLIHDAELDSSVQFGEVALEVFEKKLLSELLRCLRTKVWRLLLERPNCRARIVHAHFVGIPSLDAETHSFPLRLHACSHEPLTPVVHVVPSIAEGNYILRSRLDLCYYCDAAAVDTRLRSQLMVSPDEILGQHYLIYRCFRGAERVVCTSLRLIYAEGDFLLLPKDIRHGDRGLEFDGGRVRHPFCLLDPVVERVIDRLLALRPAFFGGSPLVVRKVEIGAVVYGNTVNAPGRIICEAVILVIWLMGYGRDVKFDQNPAAFKD